MILGEGRVLFDGEFDSSAGGLHPKSAAGSIHQIISRGSLNAVRQSSLAMFKASQRVESVISDDHGEKSNESDLIRLWQVKPLLGRLHLEFPPNKQDILVLPICYLAISFWGSFDAENPVQGKIRKRPTLYKKCCR